VALESRRYIRYRYIRCFAFTFMEEPRRNWGGDKFAKSFEFFVSWVSVCFRSYVSLRTANRALQLSSVPLDVAYSLDNLRSVLTKSAVTARSLRNSRRLLVLYLAASAKLPDSAGKLFLDDVEVNKECRHRRQFVLKYGGVLPFPPFPVPFPLFPAFPISSPSPFQYILLFP